MSRSDLRALFRSNDHEVKAVDYFADRLGEWESVARSLSSLVSATRARGFDVQDLESPRRNVLTFYGVGGIGKSTLSRRVAEHLGQGLSQEGHWPQLDAGIGPVVPVRIDLARDSGADFESMVLAIRLAAAEIGGPMPTFDLALQRYWEHNHPGETLDDYVLRRTRLSGLPGARNLSGQMQSALTDVAQAVALPGTVGNVVGQGLRIVVRALRERQHRVRALAECRRFADLLEATPDQDALSYYPHLLAWDLANVPARHRATLVVLLDTFEDVGDRIHRDLERLVQRVAWLMPGTLFVITGRNRLQWDDQRLEGQLDWAGEEFWPQLAGGAAREPRQHTVGYLSAGDCETYLSQRLTRDGRPMMDDATRRLITANSHGLPLYLDLAVMRFLDLYRRRGRAPAANEFNLDFPALVARTFRDLSPETRRVLRSVSLLETFSVPLASAAAGLDHDAPAQDLVDRPFVDQDLDAPWPYRLHSLIRDAVREMDSTSDDRWTSADWQRAARRAFEALGREDFSHRGRLVSALRQGLALAHEFDLPLGWLEDAAFRYVDDFVWEPIEPPAHSPSDGPVTPAQALATTLAAIAQRQRHHRGRTAQQLREVLSTGVLPETLEELPRYFLAECDRDLGTFQLSLEGMRQVADGGGRLSTTARRGLIHLARRIGDFPQAWEASTHLGVEGRQDRVMGDLYWSQGSIALACASYAAARDQALAAGQTGEAALSQACLAFAAAFQDRPRAAEQIARAEELLAHVTIRWAEVQTRIASLARDAGIADDLPERAEAVAAEAREAGLTSSLSYVRFVECLHAHLTGDVDALTSARIRLTRECVNGVEFAYLAELTYLMADAEPPAELPRATWLDITDHVRARWVALSEDRRRESVTARQGA
ncbi:ATP/GTP-binding protein [Streptomyces sp. NPDC046984]|uniref:ATP/GTP-binding protein n=1 Tax=Streptomyces sp. NPDC046984 TaxID=3155138 RepID=UPI0033F8E9FE